LQTAGLRRHDVSKMPGLVGPDPLIPVPDVRCVVFLHVGERPSIQTEDTRIAEMCVAGEKHHPHYLAL